MIFNELVDGKHYSIVHYDPSIDCYDLVKEYASNYWNSAGKTHSLENYLFDEDAKPWSLGPMLKNGNFELGYSVLSIDGKPWAFAGIRKHTDEIAIVLARMFCFFTVKPVCYGLLLPFHLSIAKDKGFKKAWTSFNSYNKHLYTSWSVNEFNSNRVHKRTNIMYQNNDRMITTSKFLGEIMLYNTSQTVIEWDL